LAYYVNFNYQAPNSFNRSLVYGRLCTLFKVNNPGKYSQALSEVCGGKLANVVVENPEVARDLLKHGHMQGRVTFIPRVGIHAKRIDKNTLEYFK